jgi:hypothetical protein
LHCLHAATVAGTLCLAFGANLCTLGALLCLLGILAPRLYVYARARAHASQRLRCDWLDLVR